MDVLNPNPCSHCDRSLIPTPPLQSKSERPNGGLVGVPKSTSHTDRSLMPTQLPPSRSNADTVGDLISVPLAKTLPAFCSSLAATPALELPSTVNGTRSGEHTSQ